MCGRYRLSRKKQIVDEYFDSVSGDEDWNPRYNIAPTQPVAVIRQNPKEPVRELSLMRWGLIPSWAKDSSGAARMIFQVVACAAYLSVRSSRHQGLLAARSIPPAEGAAMRDQILGSQRSVCLYRHGIASQEIVLLRGRTALRQ